MSEYIEVSEKTLDDAITSACRKLSVTSDRLEYEIIDQGSSGFLGFNARPAVIKARVKETERASRSYAAESEAAAPAQEQEPKVKTFEDIEAELDRLEAEGKYNSQEPPKDYHEYREKDSHGRGRGRDRDRRKGGRGGRRNERGREDFSDFAYDEAPEPTPAPKRREEKHVDYDDETIAAVQEKAESFLKDVFAAMDLPVEITTSFDKEENILTVNVEGDDMGVLIGKRGQTLDSLQYLVSLVINKDVEGYIHVKADTENYRERRKKTLESLAKNIAYKVRRGRRPVTLEPMNPYERRIIHSALQNDRYVTTYSVGEEPYRKVVVTLKKQ
ncbi:MAG: protein jag [Eubacterium sp.]|nr:protein jag [Eubacterium sp.]MBQ6362458.1 protein jag [Lachnospiraceae bacterium]